MSKYLMFLLFVFYFQNIRSQNFNNRLYSYNIDDITYYKYEDVKVYGLLEDISKVENFYPEQLVQSLISCSSRDWEIINTLEGEKNIENKSKEEYLQIKKMDKSKNYFELVNKVEFKIDMIPTAIIKFYYISDSFPKPQAGIFVMQKYNNRWFKTDTKMVNSLALSVLRLKPEVFDMMINNQYEIEELKKIKSKIVTNNSLDFNKLSIEIDSMYQNNLKLLEYFKDVYSIL